MFDSLWLSSITPIKILTLFHFFFILLQLSLFVPPPPPSSCCCCFIYYICWRPRDVTRQNLQRTKFISLSISRSLSLFDPTLQRRDPTWLKRVTEGWRSKSKSAPKQIWARLFFNFCACDLSNPGNGDACAILRSGEDVSVHTRASFSVMRRGRSTDRGNAKKMKVRCVRRNVFSLRSDLHLFTRRRRFEILSLKKY